jgi:V8-like Glu-specific endopeptidase
MTAGHVCATHKELVEKELAEPGFEVIGTNSQGEPWEIGRAEIIAVVNKKFKEDICIIKLKDHSLVPLSIAVNIDHVQVEDKVYFTGAPKGMFPVRREGFVIATSSTRKPFEKCIVLSLNVQSGASGSPLMLGHQVIGMIIATTSNMHDNKGLHNGAIAVPAQDLIEFIKNNLN